MTQSITRRISGGVLTAALLAVALASLAGAALSGTAHAQGAQTFRVTITNQTSPEMIISPGAYVVHDQMGAFWTAGGTASLALERIAEVGEPGEAVSALGATMIDAAPAAGDTVTFTFTASPGQYLSLVQMLVATNDGFIGVDSLALWDGADPVNTTLNLMAYDAGTEENTAPFSGFAGGQPDPAQGEANLDNGTATSEPIAMHTQVSGTQATLQIAPVAQAVPAPPASGNAGIAGTSGAPVALLALGLAAALGAAWSTRRLVGVTR